MAQQEWTLEACVGYAIEHNLNLKDYHYKSAREKENKSQSVRDLMPTISADSDYNIRYGRSVNPNTNDIINTDFFSNNYGINADISLFQGFQKLNRIKANTILFKASEENFKHQKYLLAFRVMSAFYDIRFFEGLLANSKEQEKIALTNLNLVKKQIELGLKAGGDLYEAESLWLADQLKVTRNANRLKNAQLKLSQEMNFTNSSTLVLKSSLAESITVTDTDSLEHQSIYKEAKTFVPILKSFEFNAAAAKKNIAVARGSLYPSLSLFAGYGTGYFETNTATSGEIIPFKTQLKDNASKIVGLSLKIPISQRWQARSRIKQQKIALLEAENNLAIAEQDLFVQIQELVQDAKALENEFYLSDKKMKAQELAFTISSKKYEKGLINALELFQSKNLYATAQNENLQVKLKQKVNASTLDFYKGLPFLNINPRK